jgi:hypothetical protein
MLIDSLRQAKNCGPDPPAERNRLRVLRVRRNSVKSRDVVLDDYLAEAICGFRRTSVVPVRTTDC